MRSLLAEIIAHALKSLRPGLKLYCHLKVVNRLVDPSERCFGVSSLNENAGGLWIDLRGACQGINRLGVSVEPREGFPQVMVRHPVIRYESSSGGKRLNCLFIPHRAKMQLSDPIPRK
jgi:hypothetical protein